MTAEELDALQRAYGLARERCGEDLAGFDAERWERWLHTYEHDLAELVADADLSVLASA